ncbi:vesicle-associated protein 2-1-like [Durio zibethinus]|uniref:Vesicle-associated protein 2-1-like n=1 Tax=Durio zibethinus TaxID=66656 RepID=A0A6P5ZLZ7_DURZI|nr:vesicle-associated protein 2-1-like [Durio zibethinus]
MAMAAGDDNPLISIHPNDLKFTCKFHILFVKTIVIGMFIYCILLEFLTSLWSLDLELAVIAGVFRMLAQSNSSSLPTRTCVNNGLSFFLNKKLTIFVKQVLSLVDFRALLFMFSVELEKEIFCDLEVVNNTEHHVAFKVKTTAPKRYFVRPIIGVVRPWNSCVIRVTLQAQREYPPDMKCKDKFMIQSTIVSSSTNMDNLPANTFHKERAKEIEECKLNVFFISPSTIGNSEDEGLKSSTEQSPDSNSAVHSLKDERDAAVQQTMWLQQELVFMNQAVQPLKDERDAAVRKTLQLQQELDCLKRRRRYRRNGCGCFFTFLLSENVD